MTKNSCAGLTHRGRVRKENQDRFLADPAQGLYIVSDGMGGEPGGAEASKMVVEFLPSLLEKRMKRIEHLTDPRASKVTLAALSELSAKVCNQSRDKPDLDGMGATVVLALIRDAHSLIAHLGDSRAYLLRQGHLKQLTKDHSISQLLIESGDISPEEAATHPGRHQLTRFVGMSGEALPEARSLELSTTDRLLLCSDGLSGMVGNARLLTILRQKQAPDVVCERLINDANAAGGRDNISAIVIDVA